jgi:CarD family transcriptional regulator
MPQKSKTSAKTRTVKQPTARSAPKAVKKTAKTVSKATAKPVVKSGAKAAKTAGAAKVIAKKPVAKIAKKISAPAVKAVTKKSIVLQPAKKPVVAVKPQVATAAKPAVAHKVAAPKAIVEKIVAHARPAAAAPAAVVQKSVPAAVAKPAAQRIISAPITPKEQAAKALELQRTQQMNAAAAAAKKPVNARHGFKTNEFIVYPAHGVGRIVGIEEQEIAGMALELFVITFEKDKMTLRVPTGKLQSVGMRKLADENITKRAMETLKGRARIKRTMWSRRAQEYEAKINSGDLISIAEVVRDLYRSETQPEQSYSERQLYEAALDRMAREIAAVDKLDERGAVQKITEVLSRSAKGRRAAEEAEAEVDSGDEEVQAA